MLLGTEEDNVQHEMYQRGRTIVNKSKMHDIDKSKNCKGTQIQDLVFTLAVWTALTAIHISSSYHHWAPAGHLLILLARERNPESCIVEDFFSSILTMTTLTFP